MVELGGDRPQVVCAQIGFKDLRKGVLGILAVTGSDQ